MFPVCRMVRARVVNTPDFEVFHVGESWEGAGKEAKARSMSWLVWWMWVTM